ncbi:restriction endonuclease PLD domain-containing protein [Thermoflexus sp.]|uniref:restriction endonuclease PLD domain-containing protein n=1 Tax=Thermoflexus sp. TaxID=1969742 RepID=UPI0035E41BEE
MNEKASREAFQQRELLTPFGLTVFSATLKGQHQLGWLDLFTGFRTLKAIIYSSGIDFVLSVVRLFEDAEILFGAEHTLNRAQRDLLQASQVLEGSLGDEIVVQRALMEALQERLRGHPELFERLKQRSLRFRLVSGRPSHEKLYLLADPDQGRYRVIVGSANFSRSAFEGHQRELLILFDDPDAYQAFLNYYEQIEYALSAPLELSASDPARSPWERIPLVRSDLVIIAKPTSQGFSQEVSQRAIQLKKEVERMPLPQVSGSQPVRIETKRLLQIFRSIQTAPEHPDKEIPKLRIDWESGQVFIDEHPWWDLRETPDREAVRWDVQLLLEFFEGFRQFFRGAVDETLRRYWAFWVWLYAAPAAAFLRQAAIARHLDPWLYPLFAILYGRSSGGKTTLSRVLVRSMFGQERILRSSEFTRARVEALMLSVGAHPIIAEDVANARFIQHVPELVRNDFQASAQCAPVIIATNRDVETIAQDISKRVLMVYVGMAIAEGQAGKSSLPRRVLDEVKTALYQAYLNRWYPRVQAMRASIEKGEDPPDLFQASSEILRGLLAEFAGRVPEWAHPLDYQKVFALRHRRFLEELERFMEQHPDDVHIDRGRKEVILDFGGDHNQARQFARSVPDFILKSKTVDKVVMDLEALEEELGLRFPKVKWWKRIWLKK